MSAKAQNPTTAPVKAADAPAIDFVITWVDMTDPRWKEQFARYSGRAKEHPNGVSDARFRDYGLLRYWFRGVEQFAPWVRKIHFVTCGQHPEWLDLDNPKLNLVSHKDFIPQEFLPTFNSVVIERYLHRIPGLAEHFVYFNDDMHIIRPVSPERFFRGGLPCDIAVFQYNPSWSQFYITLKNNIELINRHFDKQLVMATYGKKWYSPVYGSRARMNYLLRGYNKFITLRMPHNAIPFLKSTFEHVWRACGPELTVTSANRFRSPSDYTPELFRTWQICEGNFEPYNTYADTKMFPLLIKAKQAVEAIRRQEYTLVCINDNARIRNYNRVMADIDAAFQSILPDKSSFEKD